MQSSIQNISVDNLEDYIHCQRKKAWLFAFFISRQAEEEVGAANSLHRSYSVSFPFCSRACKSFSCKDMGQPPLAPFQKSTACFRRTARRNLWGERCLFALSPTTHTLLGAQGSDRSQDFYSALRVMSAHASSILKAAVHLLEIHDGLNRSSKPGLYHRHPENRKCKLQHSFLDTLSYFSDVCQALTRLSTPCVTVRTRSWLLCLFLFSFLLRVAPGFSSNPPRCCLLKNL